MGYQRRVHGIRKKFKGKTVKAAEELNIKNVSKFTEAYKNRSEILSSLNKKIKVDTLLVAGARCASLRDTEAMHREISPGLCSIIKVEDVSHPLAEAPQTVAEALILFCQGQGLMPTINRRMSRQESTNSQGSEGKGRKVSMTDYDTPNIRRLSLTARENVD